MLPQILNKQIIFSQPVQSACECDILLGSREPTLCGESWKHSLSSPLRGDEESKVEEGVQTSLHDLNETP